MKKNKGIRTQLLDGLVAEPQSWTQHFVECSYTSRFFCAFLALLPAIFLGKKEDGLVAGPQALTHQPLVRAFLVCWPAILERRRLLGGSTTSPDTVS